MLDPTLFAGGLVFVALAAYAILAGADFGGGVWDLFAFGPRAGAQRKTIERAIGPIWEANHVWMIVVLVVLWTCFPRAYRIIGIALHLPLTLMLIGITLRGTAFVFRTYDTQDDSVHRRWSLIFSISSIITPFLLGTAVGALASGLMTVDTDTWTLTSGYFTWASPFALLIGAWTVCLNAWLAAVYLTVEADDPALKEDFRRRALASGLLAGVFALTSLLFAERHAPYLASSLLGSGWSVALQLTCGGLGLASLWALWKRRFDLARVAAVALTVTVIGGWGLAQYPYIIPPHVTAEMAQAPDNVLWMVVGIVGAGLPFLLLAFWWLYRVFKGHKMDVVAPTASTSASEV